MVNTLHVHTLQHLDSLARCGKEAHEGEFLDAAWPAR